MPVKISLLLVLSFFFCRLSAEETTYMFRILLKDKGQSTYSIQKPEEFLSEKAILRREKQGIAIDETDLPVNTSYIFQIKNTGVQIVTQSKWLNTVSVKTTDSLSVDKLLQLPFVDTLSLVFKGTINQEQEDIIPENPLIVTATPETNHYGVAFTQIAMHNGNLLHEAGYKGAGMTIAVIDAGFHNVDCIDALNNDQILGAKTFSYTTAHPFRTKNQHGTRVLSCMLSNKANVMVGTAPEASYFLFCSEVDGSEFPIEEDFWVAAIEYADSIGVDIATTSLGYTTFDLPEMNHQQQQLDGNTILMSKAATLAAEKGMLLLNAAGNEGGRTWSTISFPSDAEKILTVGALVSSESLSSFSPMGPSADGRVKPDIMALGTSASLIDSNGNLIKGNGTSYATPIMAGLTACLWQAFPDRTNLELIEMIQRSSHKYTSPDNHYGYGIPDVFNVYEDQKSAWQPLSSPKSLIRQIGNYLLVNTAIDNLSLCKLTIYNSLGEIVTEIKPLSHTSVDLSHLPRGVYIALLQCSGTHQACKFIKR